MRRRGAAAATSPVALTTSEARVISVEYHDADHAVVVTDTVPSHLMWNYLFRTADGWVFGHDHN